MNVPNKYFVMNISISTEALSLLIVWEKEDKKLFKKFRQENCMDVIVALAEMFVRGGAVTYKAF